MSAREWKPGDVAMLVDKDGDTSLVMRTSSSGWESSHSLWRDREHTFTIRPLVVIDPEDDAQVARLTAELRDRQFNYAQGLGVGMHDVADALHSLITPPKPGEPTGLGAVVEDATGGLWVLVSDRKRRWQHRGSNDRLHWHEIDPMPVRVLSEGVTP